MIESEESLKKAADKLVEITKYYQFDGWLINIENVVDVCCIFFLDYQLFLVGRGRGQFVVFFSNIFGLLGFLFNWGWGVGGME